MENIGNPSRQLAKQKNTAKKIVFYRGACGRRFRGVEELDDYLIITDSRMTVDYFCFDPNLHTDTEYVPVKVILFSPNL